MSTRQYFSQFIDTLLTLPEAWRMIRDRQLWRGVDRYGWVATVILVAGIILGLSFLGQVINWVQELFRVGSPLSALSSLGSLARNLATEGYSSFTSGILKYVVLLLAEVLIYHFMQRTLEELIDKPVSTQFKDFFDAQVRMIKVSFRAWLLELLVSIGVSIVFGILGFLDWLEAPILFLVQCYFFGVVILDNFFEQFDLKIDLSMKKCQEYMGVALAIGLVLYLMMLIPLVGVVAGTILVSVTAAIVMNRWSDIAYVAPAPESESPGE
jgi:hypothetical protein